MKQNPIFLKFRVLGKFSFSFCKYMVWFGLRNYKPVQAQMCTLWSLNDVAARDPQKTNWELTATTDWKKDKITGISSPT